MSNRRSWKRKQLQKWLQRNYGTFVGFKVLVLVIIGVGIGIGIWSYKKIPESKLATTIVVGNSEVKKIKEILEEKEQQILLLQESLLSKENNIEEEKKVDYVLLAEHTIDNPASGENRNHNMKRVTELICGEDKDYYLLLPNETFSYLETVGDTTAEKGFLEAGVILYGEPATGIGGGVCQVTTTLNSALQKIPDLKKDDRYLHAEKHNAHKPLAYIKPENGDVEASVAFSSNKDFRVTNTLPYPLMFKFEVEGGKVTVRVFGVIER